MPRWRMLAFGASALAAAVVLGSAYLRLPPLGQYQGPYGTLLVKVAPAERHVTNTVAAVNFDYRGLDTLGEEMILFGSVVGTALLTRTARGEAERSEEDSALDRPTYRTSSAVRVWGRAALVLILVFGVYMVGHGQVSPGGGFQGGCILASAWLGIFLAGDHQLFSRLTPQDVFDPVEALGAGAYAAIGFATALAGGLFLSNILPLGVLGDLRSGGTIPLINAAVGVEVTAGMVLVGLEFLKQAVEVRKERLGDGR